MQTINIGTVSVDPTTPTALFSDAQVNALQAAAVQFVCVNPSVDIVIVGPATVTFPGVATGSAANSPLTCPASTPTFIRHRSGNIYALSSSGTATVKVSLETQV